MLELEVRHRGTRFLLVSAALVVVVSGLRALKPIALPFVIAVLLSILSAPLLSWLVRYRIPKVLAVAVTVLANVAAVFAVLLLMSGSVREFSVSVPTYQERLERRARGLFDWLESKGVDTAELSWLLARAQQIESEIESETESEIESDEGETPEAPAPPVRETPSARLIDIIDATVDLIGGTLRGIAELMTMAFLIVLMMVFLLLEAPGLPRRLRLALHWDDDDMAQMIKARRQIQQYLGIKTLISLLTGLLIALWLWILGVDFPALWGLIAFLLNFIPNIGSVLAAVPTVLLALLDVGGGQALLVAAGYLVVNILLGNFLEPLFLGRRFGISTLAVILSLVFWGWLWGPVGMLVSVPLTMVLRIITEYTEDFRWVAQLIGDSPLPAAKPAATNP